jgi:predicted Ser/Thr protein kinase
MSKLAIMKKIKEIQDLSGFRDLHWEGSFEDYLEIVQNDPRVARSAFQRLYDMIVSHGYEEYTRNRETLIHYNFFDDPFENGKDAVFGIDKQLMELVQVFRSAAHRYGTERRVILLHGPVGTAKSTIVRLLKKGLEAYSRSEDGRLYSFYWTPDEGEQMDCPMHEDPLHLIPQEFRSAVLEELNQDRGGMEKITIEGELCPACRFVYNELLQKADGDWTKVVSQIKSSASCFPKKIALVSARSSPKMRKIRTPPSSPVTSTTVKSPNTAPILIHAPSILMVNSTLPTAVWLNSSKSSNSTSLSSTTCSLPLRNTKSNPRNLRTPTSTK